MSSTAEAASLVRELSEPWEAGDNLKSAINRVARIVSHVRSSRGLGPLRHSRIEDIWRREARRIDADEMDALRIAAAAKRQALDAKGASTNAAISELQSRLARLEAMLAQIDPDFHGPTRDALRESLGGIRRVSDE